MIRTARSAARPGKDAALVPIRALLHTRGLPAIFIASVVTVTALDLLVIYMPALGAERQIDATNIGLLLTVRSAASLVSRVFYSRLIFAVGRAPLTLVSMLVQRRGVRRAGDADVAAGDVRHHGGARLRHGHRVDADAVRRGAIWRRPALTARR